MGYHHCHLPSIIIMQAEINSVGLETFINRMRKYESIMGESDRMKFLEDKFKEYELQQIQVVDKGQSE